MEPTEIRHRRDPERQHDHADHDHQVAGEVDPDGALVHHRARQQRMSGRKGDQTDRHVEPEHPLPADVVDDQATDRRPDQVGGRERGGVQAHGTTQGGAREGLMDEGGAVADEHRATDRGDHTKPDEHLDVRRDTGQQARHREDHQAAQVEPPLPPDIAEATEEEQAGGVGDHVGEQQPAPLRRARLELSAQCRQRDVQRAGVERHHRADQADHDQGGTRCGRHFGGLGLTHATSCAAQHGATCVVRLGTTCVERGRPGKKVRYPDCDP